MTSPHDCSPPAAHQLHEAETLAYLIVGVLLTVICFVIAYFWLKRIHCFPIRERSPRMSLLCLLFIWLNFMLIPTNLLVFYLTSSPILEDSYYIQFMTFFSFASTFGIYINYIFRAIRMTYVVATTYTSGLLDSMMKREAHFIGFNVVFALFFGLLGVYIYDARDVPFESVICLDDFEIYEKQSSITGWELFIYLMQCFFELVLIVLVFGLKKIKPGYYIVRELVLMVLVLVVSNFSYYLLYHLLEQYIIINLVLIRINITLRNCCFLYFSFVQALVVSHHGRAPTPTYIIFQELRYFLYDHTCVTVFHEFLRKRYRLQVNNFLFYLDFVSQRINPRALFYEYFLGNCKIEEINENAVKRVHEEFDRNEGFSFECMTELRDLAYEGLERRFGNYKKTLSCKKLVEEFEYQDLITERLFAYNMESFNMQV